MNSEHEIKYFGEAVDKVKSLGYKCFGFNDNVYNFAFITDGVNIGYMETSLGGIRFTTVHINSRGCGGGFCIDDRYAPKDITEEVIKKSFSHSGGHEWARNAYIKKYKSWEHYVKFNERFANKYNEL